MKKAIIKSVIMGGASIVGATSVFAQAQSGFLDATNDVYNNIYVAPQGGIVAVNGEEVGNEIILAGNSNDNYITNFSFEYFGTSGGSATAANFSGNVQFTLNMYANTGAPVNGYATPSSTPFFTYSSSAFPDLANYLTPTYGTIITLGLGDPEGISAGTSYLNGIQVPGRDFTYTITFTGLDPSEDIIGLSTVNGSDIGTSYNGYWDKEPSGSWQYLVNGTNNASQVEIQAVPEPSSLALVGFGGLAMLAAAKRRFIK